MLEAPESGLLWSRLPGPRMDGESPHTYLITPKGVAVVKIFLVVRSFSYRGALYCSWILSARGHIRSCHYILPCSITSMHTLFGVLFVCRQDVAMYAVATR